MKKKVLVCFDFECDRHYKYLMNAWDANDNFDLSFNDVTPDEIQSDSIPVIKANLTKKTPGKCLTDRATAPGFRPSVPMW